MYQVEAWSAVRGFWRARRARAGSTAAVSPTVIALGVTSFLTDIASEMVSTVLPIFLVLHLGLTPLHFGFVEGLYQGLTALLRIGSAAVVERVGRARDVALVGYGLSALSRLAMVAAGAGHWLPIVGAVAADRLGKGIRVVPRDLLISTSSPPDQLATAFGVHRAFDSAGAMIGPLCALAILAAIPGGFDVVFVASFSVSVCGVAALWLFVPASARPHASSVATTGAASMRSAWRACRGTPGFTRLTIAATGLALATVSDGFIYLLLQRTAGFNAGLLPLLYVATSFSYLLFAVPAGRLADRVGQSRGLLIGYGVLLGCYAMVVSLIGGWVGDVAGIAGAVLLLGIYYALTDGVLMAAASRLLPEHVRGSGLAWITTCTALARWVAAIGFGALWTMTGELTALLVAGGMLIKALVVAIALLARSGQRVEP